MSDGDIKDAGQYGFDKEDANKVLEDLKQICRGPASSAQDFRDRSLTGAFDLHSSDNSNRTGHVLDRRLGARGRDHGSVQKE